MDFQTYLEKEKEKLLTVLGRNQPNRPRPTQNSGAPATARVDCAKASDHSNNCEALTDTIHMSHLHSHQSPSSWFYLCPRDPDDAVSNTRQPLSELTAGSPLSRRRAPRPLP
jgi:hypothetical protein